MIGKCLLAPAILIVFSTHVHQYNADAGTLRIAGHAADSNFNRSGPVIESILYNPAIYKKQVSRNVIQAIGDGRDGQAHFIIHFRKEKLHGNWQTFYYNKQRCDSGGFYRNLPTGEWKTWYPNGQLKTVRTYNATKYLYIKADLQRNHPKEQRFAITRLGEQKAARYFKPQYENNPGTSGSLSLLQKIQINTSGDTIAYRPPFTTCLHHGAFVNYNENGTVKDSGQYVNGLPHGLWKESVNGGTLHAFGFYTHGVRQGQWKFYDGNNRLVYTEQYKANGKRTNAHYFK